MAGQGKKTFVAGEVLTAQDVNGYLMDQSVMNFADSGARGSAIPTPTEGMVTYLADTNAIEVYDGSAFVGVGGASGALTLLNTTDFTTSSGVAIDNVFTSTYRNYKLVLNLTAVSGTSIDILWYGRTGGSDVTTNYSFQQLIARDNSVSGFTATNSRFSNATTGGAFTTQQEMFIGSPQLAQITSTNTVYFSEQASGGPYIYLNATRHTSTNQFDGIKIFPSSGTMTGTVSIYGLAK